MQALLIRQCLLIKHCSFVEHLLIHEGPGSPYSIFVLLWVQLHIKDLCVISIQLQNTDPMLNEKVACDGFRLTATRSRESPHVGRSPLSEIPLKSSLHWSHLKHTSSASFQTGHLGLQGGEGCIGEWSRISAVFGTTLHPPGSPGGLTGTCDLEAATAWLSKMGKKQPLEDPYAIHTRQVTILRKPILLNSLRRGFEWSGRWAVADYHCMCLPHSPTAALDSADQQLISQINWACSRTKHKIDTSPAYP